MSWMQKFIREEYQIDRPETKIRIGRLFEYRDIEENSRRDAEEGYQYYHFLFDGLEYPDSLLAELGLDPLRLGGRPGYFPPGLYRHHFETLTWRPGKTPATSVLNGILTIEYQFVDSYIFCTSVAEADFVSPFPEASSKWMVRLQDVSFLANEIGYQIEKTLRAGSRSLYLARDENAGPWEQDFTMITGHAPVQYGKHNFRVPFNVVSPGKYVAGVLWRAPFFKPVQFEHEREYRFMYTFRHEGLPLRVEEKPIFVAPDRVKWMAHLRDG